MGVRRPLGWPVDHMQGLPEVKSSPSLRAQSCKVAPDADPGSVRESRGPGTGQHAHLRRRIVDDRSPGARWRLLALPLPCKALSDLV